DLANWEDEIDAGRTPVFRGYTQTRDDVIRGAVIEECLCNRRIWKDGIERRFNIEFDSFFAPELTRLRELESDRLVADRTSRMDRVTREGRIFVRTIANVFDACQAASVASKAV